MIYGLSGASGTGKTTVGMLVADSLDIEFIKTSTTESAARHGYNAVGDLNLKQRIDLQEKLLVDHIDLLRNADRPAILDRTPIDMIGYMMGEVYMNSHKELTKEEIARASAFVVNCMAVVRMNYDFIFHLAPLPFYEQANTRPSENSAYQKHTDLIMRGALSELSGMINCAVLNTTNLDERQEFIHDTIVKRMDDMETFRKTCKQVN